MIKKESKTNNPYTNVSTIIDNISAYFKIIDDEQHIGDFQICIFEESTEYVVFVIAKGLINPVMYISQVMSYINKFVYTINCSISFNDCKIYFDLMEIKGLRSPFLYKLNVADFSLTEISLQELPEDVLVSWQNYYVNNLSVLSKSMLSNSDKIKLSAYAISNTCHDEYSVERITQKFRLYLNKFVKQRSKLIDILLERVK